jgi:TPR repeat protein
MKHCILGILLAVTLAVPSLANFDAALAAYTQGDFALAYQEWLPLAESGSAAAQFNLGRLFERGEGRDVDHKQAAAWYVRAADNGFPRAQYRLAEMYETGTGVKRDLIQARKWFAVAAQARYEDAKKRSKRVAKEMTAKEIALGDMWAREYAKEHNN